MGRTERAAIRQKKRLEDKPMFVTKREIQEKYYELIKKDLDMHWRVNSPRWIKSQLWLMHNKHGWGKKRLNALLDDMVNEYMSIHKNELSIEHIDNKLNELGVNMDFDN